MDMDYDLNIFVCESAEYYHAQANKFLSSHQLADFRKCPYLYWKKHSGLIKDNDSPAYALGRAAHTLILEGQAVFEQDYVVGGPINPSTGKPYGTSTKAFAEWAAGIGKAVITTEESLKLELMEQAVLMHPKASDLIMDGVAEGVCRADYGGLPCQIRPDYFQPVYGIIDLKRCDDLTWFEADARRFGYLHQMAFYRAVLREVAGGNYPVHFIAVEKKEPYRAGVWKAAESALDFAEAENLEAIERLKYCQKNQTWPTGYEQIRVFDTL